MTHTPHFADSLRPVRCFVLDLDGTVYLGEQVFPCTLPFLAYLDRAGYRYFFVTNNSSRTSESYLHKLRNMGISVAAGQIYTSADATIRYLHKLNKGRELYLLGTEELHAQFAVNGFHTRAEQPDFVVLGFDLDFTYAKFDRACRFIRRGVPFIATHPDMNCPMPGHDMLPDCGALASAITAATGVVPKFIGKPHREMIEGLLEHAGVAPQHMAIVGDRLSTDIRAGRMHDIFSILVLTGETSEEDLASARDRPDLVVRDLDELRQILEAMKNM